MDYDAIAAHFLVPAGPAPRVVAPAATPARRLRDACEAIATIGWWSRPAAEGFVELGHGFFDGYVWGRAAALGASVSPAVVVAAFGVFEPAMLCGVLEQGRSVSTREAILATREAGATRGLAAAAAGLDVDVVDTFGRRLVAACGQLDGVGRPLFGALRSLPIPEDPHGRAWRAAELVREHRGDGHVAAIVAAGLDVVEANVLTEVWLGYPVGEYSATRGLSPERIGIAADALGGRGWLDADGALTRDGRAARDELEAATDRSQEALIAALGDELDEVVACGARITEAVLAAHAAPADPRKRAAG